MRSDQVAGIWTMNEVCPSTGVIGVHELRFNCICSQFVAGNTPPM